MDNIAFAKAYSVSRNGTDSYHFNPLYRSFLYSDGVKECAEAGCYWLLDILGTELPPVFRKNPTITLLTVECRVVGSRMNIRAFQGGSLAYSRYIDYTDMPEGAYVFLVGNDGDGKLRCILQTEY